MHGFGRRAELRGQSTLASMLPLCRGGRVMDWYGSDGDGVFLLSFLVGEKNVDPVLSLQSRGAAFVSRTLEAGWRHV